MNHRIISMMLMLVLSQFIQPLYAVERIGRLGLGMTNQLEGGIPAISFKIQRSKSFALGGILGYNSSDTDGGYGFGLKLYRNFFEEPQLNFYGALTAAVINKKTTFSDVSGFEFDLTMGSEFSFTGLRSIGFSFEFGVSLNKLDDFVIETVGDHFIVSSIHFYL
jgi:hypothetical protein